MNRRREHISSSLRDVLNEVIRVLKAPHMSELVSITNVVLSNNLFHAKVSVSVIGTDSERASTMAAITKSTGFISFKAANRIRIRRFPKLHFELDKSVDRQFELENLIASR